MYNIEVDKKWQDKWEKDNVYKYDESSDNPKYYMLEMFSYPSGAKLHIGHWFNYGLCDSFARFKKMNGYNVFHPMGFDSFGLPAENYAIKTGVHPKDSTEQNIENMIEQLKQIGGTYDWNYMIETHKPEYYKWTQWLFSELYKKGLAYRKEAPVNWCPSCNTVLANEQVVNGECERCDSVVERKKLKQWFFKIRDYAQELIDDLDKIDWPENTKKIQKNWIGRSEGTEFKLKLEKSVEIEGKTIDSFSVFSTRIDTIFGITFISVAPESDFAKAILTDAQRKEAEKYIEDTRKLSELERNFDDREKTGVFTGSYAIHPFTGEKIPMYLADYVIDGYGSGVVMGVPAHDTRDYDFAKKIGLEIKPVIEPFISHNYDLASYDIKEGRLINSGKFNGLSVSDAKVKITEELEKKKNGQNKINYRLKDWLVSRQRYWGAPIPIIYCDKCGEILDENLPVELPYDVEFKPDGISPLAKSKEFVNTKCPKCGRNAKREVDTLDTFVCSSWYELRYIDSKNDKQAFSKEKAEKMLPVDMYVGGAEHASMHLIYTRFITKVLRDLGYLNIDESFKTLKHQGLILGPDGNKMSKSKGNTIAPDEIIEKYGSDVLRMYLMFGFAYEEGGPWSNEGLQAMSRYITRVDNMIEQYLKTQKVWKTEKNILTKALNITTEEYVQKILEENEKDIKKIEYEINRVIKAVTKDLENFEFNTAIARLMEMTNLYVSYLNNIDKIEDEEKVKIHILLKESFEKFLTIFSVFAPHFIQEQYSKLGYEGYIYNKDWPKVDQSKLVLDEINLPVQVNGKVRQILKVAADLSEEEIKELIHKDEKIQTHIQGKDIVKEIYIPKKIYNIVVK